MIQRVRSVGLPVADLEQALAFYTQVLPFQVVAVQELAGDALAQLYGLPAVQLRLAELELGVERIHLMQFLQPSDGRPIPADSRSDDLWFQHLALVVSDMDAAFAQLQRHSVALISRGPQTLPPSISAAAGIRACYFRDPDGHPLELIAYPPDKGQARWQSQADLFLGIDHTASAASDTPASRAHYGRLEPIRITRQYERR